MTHQKSYQEHGYHQMSWKKGWNDVLGEQNRQIQTKYKQIFQSTVKIGLMVISTSSVTINGRTARLSELKCLRLTDPINK